MKSFRNHQDRNVPMSPHWTVVVFNKASYNVKHVHTSTTLEIFCICQDIGNLSWKPHNKT
jgi:hypothetical protein